CAVIARAAITDRRYESYRRLLADLKSTHHRQQATSSKIEAATKTSGGGALAKRLVRIGAEQREDSRRTTRQRLAELASRNASAELGELEEFDA
ncbi:MAG: hypothetical protein KGR26_01550, partial [Cyanobacteria bacterium REEB65]|nr:hypothetical protein [Cyanobacteria bacterium REEB65]